MGLANAVLDGIAALFWVLPIVVLYSVLAVVVRNKVTGWTRAGLLVLALAVATALGSAAFSLVVHDTGPLLSFWQILWWPPASGWDIWSRFALPTFWIPVIVTTVLILTRPRTRVWQAALLACGSCLLGAMLGGAIMFMWLG